MDRNEMIATLKENVVDVTFTKADGTVRNMTCTLLEEKIPPVFLNGTEQMEQKTRKTNSDVIAVVDIDINQWRSFRVDSVTKFTKRK